MKLSYQSFPEDSQETSEEDIEDDLVVHNEVRRGNFMSNLSDKQLLKIAQQLSDNMEIPEEEVSQEDMEDNFVYDMEQVVRELKGKFSELFVVVDNLKNIIETGNVSNFSPNAQLQIMNLVEVVENSHEELGSLLNSIVV